MTTPLMHKTGRKVLDKNGRVVDEMKEDQIFVRVYDPENTDIETNPYRTVLRSNFRLKTINRLFECNAHYIKDQFENVIWPKEWLFELRAPTPGAPWKYEIVVKDEPELIDDGLDPRYEGSTVVRIANVPKQVQEKDLRAWLMAGLIDEYEPITNTKFDVAVLTKKREMLKYRIDDVPTMDLEGKPQEQIDTRQKLVKAMGTQMSDIDKKLAKAMKKLHRCIRLLESEPIELSFLKDGTELRYIDKEVENEKEKYNWFADFKSLRGPELALLAVDKPDWGALRLATTRPDPTVSKEELNDPTHEVNMHIVRVARVRHGRGDHFVTDTLPTDEDFHFSSIDAMYSGNWVSGMKHDSNAIEYTNYGIYEGAYVYNIRDGRGKLVYGKGDMYQGFFDVPKAFYTHRDHPEPYPRPMLPPEFNEGVPHGMGCLRFADGATYEGEMKDGRVTGQGRYVSSTGVIEEGEFLDGLLHGEGSREEPNGHYEEGTFEYGVLQGDGTQRTKHNDLYEGSFEYGSRCGRGVMQFHDESILTGFWEDDLPSGRGDYLYYRKEDNSNEGKFPFLYEGSFSEGKVKGRHRHVDVENQTQGHVPFTTYGKSITHMTEPTTLASRMMKHRQRHHKNFHRRQVREAKYLEGVERENLTMYYNLLDEFYEAWVEHVQGANQEKDDSANDDDLSAEELEALRLKKKKAKKPSKSLKNFSEYIKRVPLSTLDRMTRALYASSQHSTGIVK